MFYLWRVQWRVCGGDAGGVTSSVTADADAGCFWDEDEGGGGS